LEVFPFQRVKTAIDDCSAAIGPFGRFTCADTSGTPQREPRIFVEQSRESLVLEVIKPPARGNAVALPVEHRIVSRRVQKSVRAVP
jgi:hypothetical protein